MSPFARAKPKVLPFWTSALVILSYGQSHTLSSGDNSLGGWSLFVDGVESCMGHLTNLSTRRCPISFTRRGKRGGLLGNCGIAGQNHRTPVCGMYRCEKDSVEMNKGWDRDGIRLKDIATDWVRRAVGSWQEDTFKELDMVINARVLDNRRL